MDIGQHASCMAKTQVDNGWNARSMARMAAMHRLGIFAISPLRGAVQLQLEFPQRRLLGRKLGLRQG